MKPVTNFPAKTALAVALLSVGFGQNALANPFTAGNLIVSETTYSGIASTVTVGQNLSVKTFNPDGTPKTYNKATADGSFSNVFKNEVPDPSFGVTSAISLVQMNSTNGALASTMAIDTNKMVTSFASKSELALNISTDGKSLSFMGYAAPVNALDVSNSNTAQVVDSTNPVTSTYSRAIGSVDLSTGNLSVTNVNAYSGNNGRAAIEANGNYYMVGNAGNGSGDGTTLSNLSNNTGVQTIAVGSSGNTTVVGASTGTYGNTSGYQNGFAGFATDKTGKVDNFRGETISSDGTMYVTKGSGSNGVDTVYQVGDTHAFAAGSPVVNPATATITVVNGFNTASEKVVEAASTAITNANTAASTFNTANAAAITAGTVTAHTFQSVAASEHPFGIWVANATTMFVADEGDGIRTDSVNIHDKNTTNAGLQEWSLSGGIWHLDQIFQTGLVGVKDLVAEATLGWSVQEDGLRNISGQTNADGSFTIYGTTSTVSNETTHDLGADPNQIVAINVFASSTAANTSFNLLSTAAAGSRFGGLAIAPEVSAVPVPAAAWLFGTGLLGFFGAARKRKAI